MSEFVQRCIKGECRSVFGIDDAVYVCARCGDLLVIERSDDSAFKAEALRAIWRKRRMAYDIRDRSGVWRFREYLPFDDGVEVVSLGEGNTQIYEAPRCAEYCGIDALRLKHQGNNPTGSFKDTGMTVALKQARKLGMRRVVCARAGNTAAS